METERLSPETPAPESPEPEPTGTGSSRSAGAAAVPAGAVEGVPSSPAAPAVPAAEEQARSVFQVEHLNLWYGRHQALDDITLEIPEKRVTAFIGPSGCGKSTLLRCFNRLNDLVDDCRIEGGVRLNGRDIYAPEVDVDRLRRKVGMVFQKPNPFPKSIYENVAYGLRIQGIRKRRQLDEAVEWALHAAALWDEVEGRLDEPGLSLSGGQQQRLVIARAIAVQPQVILLDEPCSALDPISTLKVEELIHDLARDYTIIIVTHNMQQAARVSDFTAFLYMGGLVEFGETDQVFTNPSARATEDYITGRYG